MSEDRPELSVCIIACNEERDLPRCLASVAFADEIIVIVDDRSGDATEKLAREAGAEVLLHAYDGNVEQKNLALDRARGQWVLALDADEALSDQLAAEIRAFLAQPPSDVAGMEINRLTWHLGRWIRHGEFYPDWQLRVFRNGAGRWAGTNPHGRVELSPEAGSQGRFRGEAWHWSYRDLADQVDRIQDFSSIQARANLESGRSHALRDMILRPPARFARAFLLKQGYRDGVPGFIIAAATAFHVFLKYAKQWEQSHLGSGKNARDAGNTGQSA
ncbi:MAG: glycosyltransferase family 2 protein [bacterium]|nr:glycosyltransferase family 2 protein [bacterium]